MNIKKPKRETRRPFLWTFLTTLNLFLVVAVWVSVSTLLSQPERPICYSFLGLIGKQPELKVLERNDLGSALVGLDAQEMSLKYGGLNHLQLKDLNQQLLRGYITNYRRSEDVPVVYGDFELLGARLLGEGDFIETGMVLLARSAVRNEGTVYLEYILPTTQEAVVDLTELGLLRQGGQSQPTLTLRSTKQLAALTHVAHLENSDLLFSAIPVSYQSPRFAGGKQLDLEPPSLLNVKGGLPVVDLVEMGLDGGSSAIERDLAADFR